MTSSRRLDLVRHMEYFVALVDERHFGRAAERLGMSQPPLSQGIQRLEERLGSTLVVRETPVRLTDAGDDLLPKARALLAQAADIEREATSARQVLRLGLPPGLPLHLADGLVTALAAPSRPVLTTTAPTHDLVRQIGRRTLDIALVEHPCVVSPDVEAADVAVRVPRRALLPAAHRLAGRRRLRLADLTGEVLALPPRGDNPPAHDLLADLLAVHGVAVATTTTSDDRESVLAVATGTCVGLTTARRLEVDSCRIVPIDGDPLPLRLRVIAAPSTPADVDAVTAAVRSLVRRR